MPWRSPALSMSPKDYWFANHAKWAERRHASYDPGEGGYGPPPPTSEYGVLPAGYDPYGGPHQSTYGGPHQGSYGGPHGDPYGGSHGGSYGGRHRVRGMQWVGALANKDARAFMEKSDAVVREQGVPIMDTALAIQDDIFKIADGLGFGDEGRDLVYTIRSYSYASAIASNVMPAAAASAGAAVLVGVGAFAAIGGLAVVGGIVNWLFDDDSDSQARTKKAQQAALHLLDRLSIEGFAQEQDAAASVASLKAMTPWFFNGSAEAFQAEALKSQRIALIYRAADKQLPGDKKAIFESLSNLARWAAVKQAQEALPKDQRDSISNLLGTSGPSLESRLAQKIKEEQTRLASLGLSSKDSGGGGAWAAFALTLVAAGGALAVVRPDVAAKGLGYAKAGVKTGSKVAFSAARYLGAASKHVASAAKKVV